MFALPGMLMPAAEKAGIPVPYDPENYDKDQFLGFAVFCLAQLGRSMPYPGVHFDNAKVIAGLTEEELKTITIGQLVEKGFKI